MNGVTTDAGSLTMRGGAGADLGDGHDGRGDKRKTPPTHPQQ